MQDSFIAFDYSQEANNYCPEDYDPNNEIIVEFKDSAKKLDDFESTLLIPHGFENIDSFYYAFFTYLDIMWKIKNNECVNEDELKKDLVNDELYDKLLVVKEKLRPDIQNFENQCFSVNDLLNDLFLGVYELKDKF